MYENETQKAQERLNAALSLAKQQPEEAINMIADMQKWVDENIPNDTLEYLGVAITYNEVCGDLSIKQRKFVQAEKYYKKMVERATDLYNKDHEKYDLRLSTAYAKLANNCRCCIGAASFGNKPRELTEKEKRPFDAGMNFYKVAMKVSVENAKKGSGRHLELRCACLSDMATMSACIGNYADAISMLKEVVGIQKAMYQQLDNKESGAKLGGSLTTLATIYSLEKNNEEAMDTLEDAIFVLSEHEKEDPVRAGVLMARGYINLAGSYIVNKEDQQKINDAYDKGTQKISMVNAIAKNTAIADEITCYMLSGQYFKYIGQTEKGMKQLEHAHALSAEAAEKTNSKQFEMMKHQIEGMMNSKKAE